MCTPISVRAACAAKLEAGCAGGCNEVPGVDCQGTCSADCSARCSDLDPGMFDCEVDCKADCSGTCAGHCETARNAAECEATCTASCDAECAGSCDVELPEADCSAGCDASCEGSCDVEANLDCQIDCQAEGFADCEAEVEGGCKIACETTEGALFCDGQYVDHGDNLQECIAALEAALNLKVETHAEADCAGNRCEASASAKISSGGFCTVSSPRGSGAGGGVLLGALSLLAARVRRRRRLACRSTIARP
jgi:hypothetical protein